MSTVSFSKKFIKSLRLHMDLNEREMASHLDVEVGEYLDFEENPLQFTGALTAKYLNFLDKLESSSRLSLLFTEFVRYDTLCLEGAVNIYDRFPLQVVNKNGKQGVKSIG